MKVFVRYFIKGVFAILPVVFTIWVVTYIAGILIQFIKIFYSKINNPLYSIILIIATVLLITYIGYIITKKQKSIILYITENIFSKVPVIKSIYNFFKELIHMFTNDKNYLGVVEIMFANYKTYAFLTKEEKERFIAFVPTAPNPTSGYVILLDKDKEVKGEITALGEWKRVDTNVKEALGKIISLGIK
ncbi:hypothetical protein C3L23_01805 [Nautilia sp. PV-1]|uniref:DUF502 domain-containing protein n=1 Tax=Nautilia sp. PV-1 TaxID=2579250 RepID=UPI000FD86ED1|nr:DUF502 domain-containing protein [Nautilia sp. PV-1]AZV46047.1 hypothetical protein C3L23_01805 [Nautilia sp. PV-1]